jgi:hypothetical protein
VRIFLTCNNCGGRLVLYRITEGRAHPRGRDNDLHTFLQEHAECGPFLSVETEADPLPPGEPLPEEVSEGLEDGDA